MAELDPREYILGTFAKFQRLAVENEAFRKLCARENYPNWEQKWAELTDDPELRGRVKNDFERLIQGFREAMDQARIAEAIAQNQKLKESN